MAKGGLGRLKDLIDLAGQVDMKDLERFRKRAENIETLLQENNRLLQEILSVLKEISNKLDK